MGQQQRKAQSNGNVATMEAMLPQDIEAEMGVLGSIIIDPEAVEQVVDILKPEDFYRDAHQAIYRAIMDLYDRHEPADFITVGDALDEAGKLELAGGASYISSLINIVPTSGNIAHYAGIVAKKARYREIINVSGQMAAHAYEQDERELENVLQSLYTLQATAQKTDLTPTRDMSTSFMERMDMLTQNKGAIIGTPSGFTDLDRMTAGLQKSDLIVVAGRPGTGKTTWAMTVARNASLKGFGVAVFSIEMASEQIYQRLISMEAGIDQQKLKTGFIDDEQWERLIAAMETYDNAPLWIDDTPAITCREIESKLRRLMASGVKIDLVIVDYLQFMSAGSHDGNVKRENRVQEVSEIARGLKKIARTLNIPVVALAQLSRTVEARQCKIPMLSDLRESGEIEQTADIVMFIYREDMYNPDTERKNIADIIVAKHRNGPLGQVSLYAKMDQTTFMNLEVSPLMASEEGGSSWEN